MKVTVGVRSHSYAPFVTRCLNSLVAQDFPRDQMEVIVVQDAGRAPPVRWTRERVRNLGRKVRRSGIGNFRFESVGPFSSDPLGHGEMSNIILSLASGDTIMFLDSDDFVGPQHVRELYTAWWLQSGKDAVSANCLKSWFDASGKPVPDKRSEAVLVTVQNYFDFGALLCIGAKQARATGGLIHGSTVCEDREWLTRTDSRGNPLISWAATDTPPSNYIYVQHTFARPHIDREDEWRKLKKRLEQGELLRPTKPLEQCDDLKHYFRDHPVTNMAAMSKYRGQPQSHERGRDE